MSQQHLEDRVAVVEREQARQGVKIDGLAHDMSKVTAGVDKLLEREGKRGEVPTLKTVGATVVAIGSILYGGSWLVEQAPVVERIVQRLDKLDDKDTGRVTRLEQQVWHTTVRASP